MLYEVITPDTAPASGAIIDYLPRGCIQGPAADCGCWSTTLASNATYCAVPASLGQYNQTQAQVSDRFCQALPGSRYLDLLQLLGERRVRNNFV